MLKKTKKGYFILSKFASQRGIIHGFSTRQFGNMSFKRGEEKEVVKNRLKFAKALNFDKEKVVQMSLVHKTKIALVEEKDAGHLNDNDNLKQGIDGLVTNLSGIFLFLVIADCAPFLFYDRLKKVIGLAHVGWRGAVGKLPNLMVEKMVKKFGSSEKDILVGIGPALCGSCDVQEKPVYQEDLVEWEDYLHPMGDKMRIENIRFSIDQLIKTGIPEQNLEWGGICTKEHRDEFFSWEAAQAEGKEEEEGRFAAVIGLV